jgi:WD40 repeat protein
MLVTSGDDDSACIWNVGSRSLMRKFRDNEHTVFCSEFTPDSKHLFTSDANGDLRLWDVASNHNKSLVCVEEAHDLGVLCCEFAPWNEDNDSTSLDRKFILATGGNDDCVKLWTVITGLNVKIVSRKRLSGDHSSAVMCLRFTKDGKFLASTGGDKLVCIYSVVSRILNELNEFQDSCHRRVDY